MNISKSDSYLSKLKKKKEENQQMEELRNINVHEVTNVLCHKLNENDKKMFESGIEFMRKRISIELSNK